MALSYAKPTTNEDSAFLPPYQLDLYDITFDSSYPTGGLALGDGTTGIPNALVVGFQQLGGSATLAGYEFIYNTSSKKLQVYKSSQGATTEYSGVDLKGMPNPAGTEAAADQPAIPTNGALLYGGNTFTTMAGTATITTNPDIPRNVVLTVYNSTGGALNLYQGTTTYTVTGTDVNGNALTETIPWTSTSGNKAIAAGKYRWLKGNKAFATISTVTYDNAADGSLTLYVGPGPNIGLPVALATAAVADVKFINNTATQVTPGSDATASGGVDTAYNTINMGAQSNNWDFTIIYNAIANEVASGTDLSAVSIRGLIWHRR